MRLIAFFAVILTLAVPADAALIIIGGQQIGSPILNSPIMGLNFYHRDYDAGITSFVTSAAVTPIPSETPLNWTINESNAGEYGLDWSALLGWCEDLDVTTLNYYPSRLIFSHGQVPAPIQPGTGYPFFQLGLEANERLINFQLDHIEIEQVFWINLPFLRSAEIYWRLVGTGEIVPEPTTLILCALGLLFFSSRVRTTVPT